MIEQLLGLTAYDATGKKVGPVITLHSCATTGEIAWATVAHGVALIREALVPLAGCELTDDGLWLRVTKEAIKSAPQIEIDGPLAPHDLDRLTDHYGSS